MCALSKLFLLHWPFPDIYIQQLKLRRWVTLTNCCVHHRLRVRCVPLLQVWDVRFSTPNTNSGSSSTEAQEFTTIAVARLSLIIGLPDPEKARPGNEKLIAIARKNNVELAPQVVSKL